MTPEERQLLTDLANKVTQAPSTPKDPEADDLIRTQIGSRPDALYVLTQTVLIQNMAIEHAKQQIQELQRGAPSPQAPSSFIGPGAVPGVPRGSGWTAPPSAPPGPQPQYNAPYQAPYSAPPPQAPPAPSGMSSFLRNAAVTATGVAAGALAFEGIRSLFGGVEHMFGFGGGSHPGSFLGGGVPGETVTNNYYDSPGGGRDFDDRSSGDDSNTVDVPDDSSSFDDNSVDDSSFDDSGSSGDDSI